MKKLITTALFLTGLCGYASAQKVVSGIPVTNNSADFFCSLVDPISATVEPFCGAALIAPQWVITAGHCTFDFMNMQTLTDIDVVIHPYYRNATPGTYLRVAADTVIPHPAFNMMGGSLEHDIALIRLQTPVPNAQVLDLPADGDTLLSAAGKTAYVVGYGVYDTTQPWIQPDTLQMAEVDVIANSVCNEPVRYGGAVLPSMICAGKLQGESKGGGAGDSGGPLYVVNGGQKTQIGVVSFGQGPYSTNLHPGVYTRIASYRAWINAVMGNEAPTFIPGLDRSPDPTLSQNENGLLITFPESTRETMSYTIYNTSGQTVQKGTIQKGAAQARIVTENYSNGLYLVHVHDNKGFSFAGKFIQGL